ncbi:hypothetical protein FKM82_017387 [Ascaphus truei]
MSYIGRTIRPVRIRIQEHIRHILKKDMLHPVSRHFSMCSLGDISNFSFSALEHVKIHPRGGDRLNKLNTREMYWIHVMNTLHPTGINIEWDLKHFLV